MIIICGKTIEEVERDLEMAKAAIATGAPMGIGGATMADVEQALHGLREAVGADNAPIDNPNYTAPCGCCCDCDCDPMSDEECDNCEYYEDEEEEEYEDEEEDEITSPALTAFVELLRHLGADADTINKLLS